MYWADNCPHKNEKGSAYLVEGSNGDDDDDDDDDNSKKINIVLITE